MIEFKAAQVATQEGWAPLTHLESKFVGSSKALVEALGPVYPDLEIVS